RKSYNSGSEPPFFSANRTVQEHSVASRMLACHENVTVVAANGEQLRIKGESRREVDSSSFIATC
ncbi:MAG: hypothetical protein WA735_09650, partial [Candidatus Acidiferrales bacterium]